ncbi:hypothetical protein BH09VER1_BH09VER1_20110 [soil metagenome]
MLKFFEFVRWMVVPPKTPDSMEPGPGVNEADMLEANREFYDPLWELSDVVRPEKFNTWPMIRELTANSLRRLEVGPGLRPRLPLDRGTTFLDLSPPAVAKLKANSADAMIGVVSSIPFADATFDVVCALDIVEHVDDDEGALSELSRVAKPGAVFIVSVPLHPSRWQPFDTVVGHRRRYEPEAFFSKLRDHGFSIERSADYGMQPDHPRLVEFGMKLLKTHQKEAMWWYNKVFMRLGLKFQSKLETREGVGNPQIVDQILLICRKTTGEALVG